MRAIGVAGGVGGAARAAGVLEDAAGEGAGEAGVPEAAALVPVVRQLRHAVLGRADIEVRQERQLDTF